MQRKVTMIKIQLSRVWDMIIIENITVENLFEINPPKNFLLLYLISFDIDPLLDSSSSRPHF